MLRPHKKGLGKICVGQIGACGFGWLGASLVS